MNRFHQQHKLLNAIRPHSPPLSSLYEERTGQPPLVRWVCIVWYMYMITTVSGSDN